MVKTQSFTGHMLYFEKYANFMWKSVLCQSWYGLVLELLFRLYVLYWYWYWSQKVSIVHLC
jgi:hypothetical protein